jgi:hypothetical protein
MQPIELGDERLGIAGIAVATATGVGKRDWPVLAVSA